MSDIDYAARVQRGAALLDEKWPTWATDIDLAVLDIENGYRCVTAQYSAAQGEESHWRAGRLKLGLDMDAYEEHGFMVAVDQDYPSLTTLWRGLILRRREAAQPQASER